MTVPCIQIEKLTTLSVIQNQMSKDIAEIKECQKETNFKLDNLLDKLDRKYASKWTEWVIKGLIGIILVAVIGAMVSQVVK